MDFKGNIYCYMVERYYMERVNENFLFFGLVRR